MGWKLVAGLGWEGRWGRGSALLCLRGGAAGFPKEGRRDVAGERGENEGHWGWAEGGASFSLLPARFLIH